MSTATYVYLRSETLHQTPVYLIMIHSWYTILSLRRAQVPLCKKIQNLLSVGSPYDFFQFVLRKNTQYFTRINKYIYFLSSYQITTYEIKTTEKNISVMKIAQLNFFS